MWPLGHAAIAYLLYSLFTRTRLTDAPTALPAFIVLFGSQFPDLVDKPLAWYFGVLPTGRTLAHSLLVLIPLSLLLYAIARRYGRPEYGIAFAIGALSHALVDAVPALWGETDPAFLLWPLVSVEPYEEGAPTVLSLLQQSIGEPYFLVEFVLALVALSVWNRDGRPGLGSLRSLLDRVRSPSDAM